MRLNDLLAETFAAVTVNKVRSGLTMLGIVIGIGSVISLMALGTGAQQSIESNIQSIGSNLLMVRPGASRSFGGFSSGAGSAQSLTMDDVAALEEKVPDVANIAPEVGGRYQVTARGTNTNTTVTGTIASYSSVRNVEVESGFFITSQHMRARSKVAVLGPDTVLDLFGEGSDPIGASIRINKMDFKIIGVTRSKGSDGWNSSDDVIYVPLTTHMQFLSGTDKLSMISIEVTESSKMNNVQAEVDAVMLEEHNISNPALADFRITNQSDIIATMTSVTSTFTSLLTAIAAISLLVGGIGIMNMMLTTVTERTREIGLRKAIGAKRADIILQFLGESVLLTFIGGGIGIILGWGVAKAAQNFANIPAVVSTSSVLLAFGVSAAIGIIFGYYPARRASRLHPIEALRYE